MQKIMFNDRYGLTQAVIEGRKTMTRRIEGGDRFQSAADLAVRIEYESITNSLILIDKDGAIFVQPLRYKVGEVVAVAQSYEQAGIDPEYHIEGGQLAKTHPGWRNKMFVKAELMPHQIRITGVRCERLQDITDAECLKEGVRVEFAMNGMPMYYYFDTKRWREAWFDTPRDAFASLIDKVSGKGTWQKNPWVVVYEFELVK
jgi:hypothetical protein|nr:MAG TPA: ASCH domain protein [Caudoviricetes sp.]